MAEPDVLRSVSGRTTHYALRRVVAPHGSSVPLYNVSEAGVAVPFGSLSPVEPRGFHFDGPFSDGFYPDLPWFLHDLRPAGFLGRQVPLRHPDLQLPRDITRWSGDDALRYLATHGWAGSGSFIVGDAAMAAHVRATRSPEPMIAPDARAATYAALAEEIQRLGPAGSSAAGEQPKFLAVRGPSPTHVLVKFSPRMKEGIGRRWADLLRAEHHALETVRAHGRPAARSELVTADDRVFLEVERFDRVGAHGRRGLVSLLPLQAHFGGAGESWSAAVSGLARAQVVPREVERDVRWLEVFGELIANSDRHPGNLSFALDGLKVTALAPAYDVLPMRYAPVSGEVVAREVPIVVPRVEEREVWPSAVTAAIELWSRVAADPQISDEFRRIADAHRAVIASE